MGAESDAWQSSDSFFPIMWLSFELWFHMNRCVAHITFVFMDKIMCWAYYWTIVY